MNLTILSLCSIPSHFFQPEPIQPIDGLDSSPWPLGPPGAVAPVLQRPLARRAADRVGLPAAVPVPRPAGGRLRRGRLVKMCGGHGIVQVVNSPV